MNIVITGGSKGMGKAMAEKFAAANHHIFICSRNETELSQTAAELNNRYNNSVQYFAADLSQKEEVIKFAQWILDKNINIDILINNAGVMMPPPSKTDNGFELQFGVNFLGHFALTGHLFSLLKNTASARVVTLSSGAATLTDGIDFDNLKLRMVEKEGK